MSVRSSRGFMERNLFGESDHILMVESPNPAEIRVESSQTLTVVTLEKINPLLYIRSFFCLVKVDMHRTD